MEINVQSIGTRLRVKDGLFQVTVPDLSGLNHHLEEQFAAHQVEAVFLGKGTSVSTDALLLALKNGTDIAVLDEFGLVAGRIIGSRPTSTTVIWQNQLALADTPAGFKMAIRWICEKLHARIAHLRKLKGYRDGEKRAALEKAQQAIADSLVRIHRLPTHDPGTASATLRGLEGIAGRHYFEALSAVLPEEYRFARRSTQPAQDEFNAFLNYAYGILYNKVERALLRAGVHPHVGFFHVDDYQRKTMVFDFIEPFRAWAEQVVFNLFARKTVSSQHTCPAPKGKPEGLWLSEDGKRLLAASLRERMGTLRLPIGDRTFDLHEYLIQRAVLFGGQLLRNKLETELDATFWENALRD